MSHCYRLVSQQMAFAKYQLQQRNNGSAFAERCQSQATLLQLSLALSAYAGELLDKAGLRTKALSPLAGPSLFRDAQAQVLAANKFSSDLDECAALEQNPSWLSQLLAQIGQLTQPQPGDIQSPLLNHTSLAAEDSLPLIATSGARPQNVAPALNLELAVAAFEAMIERHRSETAEY